ncbi:MAG TPA: SUMF1/EgtB/PvdO family nonheme iron enzyme [Bacteroidales bacterium]|nr:SUMF1/EgtB/PvdO family nonheme iron enzyme [Bacteroidales bacterium]
MRKNLIIGSALILLASCSSYDNGELTGVQTSSWNEPNPYGMILIRQGTFELGQSATDSIWGTELPSKKVSVGSFWMDETEITNGQYKQFVKWVCDSIIRERLADPLYGGNDEYKITENQLGDPIPPYLNRKLPIPDARRATEEELSALNYLTDPDPIRGDRRLVPERITYRYNWFDQEAASKRENQLILEKRERNTDVNTALLPQVMIEKDTAYFSQDGRIVRETLRRPLRSMWDFVHTYIVEIYPDTTCWVNDFENSYNLPYLINYFSHPGYSAHPVVGVSWEQAKAFCHWRTEYLNSALRSKGQKVLEYRLPTEAEWEYAARGGKLVTRFPWEGEYTNNEKNCFYANFKTGEGDFSSDGGLIPVKVASYPANEYGLYDMAGNVAEWTSSTWSASSYQEMNDLNPEFKFESSHNDPYLTKRKVVRGGSWKDPAQFIQVNSRTYEYQNETRSYIGFRCVRSQIGGGGSK